MSFLLSIGLVAAAAVMIVLGAVQSSPIFFTSAAVASGAAVFLMWRRAADEKEHVFLSDPPPASQPNWDRKIRSTSDSQPGEDETRSGIEFDDARLLGIPRYDELVAAEILPSLETLSIEELRAVLAREQRGLAREAVIQRARRLIDLTSGSLEVDRTPTPPRGTSMSGPGRNRRPQRKSLQKDGPELSL